MENFLQLILALQDVVAKMQEQSADFPAQLVAIRAEGVEEGKRSRDQEISDLIMQKDQEKMDFGASEYLRGFQDGAASIPPQGDKIYSQAEVDQMLEPLNQMVLALRGENEQLSNRVAELEVLVSGFDARIAQAIQDALMSAKARLDEAEAAIFLV